MKTISIVDRTLCVARPDGGSLSFKEKLEAARQLGALGVDAIQTLPVENERTDLLWLHTAAGIIGETALCCPMAQTIEQTQAIAEAMGPNGRLIVELPISAVGLEYQLHKKPEALAAFAAEQIALCRDCGVKVELRALDATRANPALLDQVLAAAKDAGVSYVTLCDSAGTLLRDECVKLIHHARSVLGDEIALTLCCSDALNLGCANALCAAFSGADGATTCLQGGELPACGALTRAISLRGSEMGVACTVDATGISRATERLAFLFEDRSSPALHSAATAADLGEFTLDESCDRAKLYDTIGRMGYDLSPEDLAAVYDGFRSVVTRKPVGRRELDAIIASNALQVPSTYVLENYVVNCSNAVTPTASIALRCGDRTLQGLCSGNGPIDAAFLAIEQIAGRHFELDEFQIQAVTEGHEAMGETLVKLRHEGRLYSGRGISTDIIGSAILAYVSALNKIVYDQEQ